MAEPDRLGQVLVQPERARDDTGDPRRLERVGHARAVVVAGRVDEDLRLALQAPERLRVEDAIAVALERRADAALLLVARPAGGVVRAHGERREGTLLLLADPRGEGVGDPPCDARARGHGSRQDQMMIGTVPPSTDQAAPVTYEARSDSEEHDHVGDLAGLREPAQRPPGGDLGEHLVAVALLVGETARRRATPPSPSGPASTALQRMPSVACTSATRRENESSAAFITE